MDPKVIAQLLFGARIAVGIAFLAVCIAWDRQAPVVEPVRTRPASSNRKAGRAR